MYADGVARGRAGRLQDHDARGNRRGGARLRGHGLPLVRALPHAGGAAGVAMSLGVLGLELRGAAVQLSRPLVQIGLPFMAQLDFPRLRPARLIAREPSPAGCALRPLDSSALADDRPRFIHGIVHGWIAFSRSAVVVRRSTEYD